MGKKYKHNRSFMYTYIDIHDYFEYLCTSKFGKLNKIDTLHYIYKVSYWLKSRGLEQINII